MAAGAKAIKFGDAGEFDGSAPPTGGRIATDQFMGGRAWIIAAADALIGAHARLPLQSQ